MNIEDEPPLHKDPITIATWLLLALMFAFVIWTYTRTCVPENYNYIPRGESVVRQISPHFLTKKVVLASLMDKIIYCESKFDPTAKNPKSTAYGLCQFLDGTWEYVQDKWKMELDREDPDDQLYACNRLLSEEGLSHWKSVWKCIGYK